MGINLKLDGGRIRALRLERRWEREQLARIADVSMEDLRELEFGGSASLETIQALAGVFGLKIQELLRGAEGSGISAFIPPEHSSGFFSKSLQNQVRPLLLPYLPIVKSALAASALALLTAFAIRLSPFIINRNAQSELVESFEIFQPAYTAGEAALEAEMGTEVLSDSEDPAANPRYAYKRPAPLPQSARINLPAGAGNPLIEPTAPAEDAHRSDIYALPEARIDYWSTADSAIAFRSADFASLALAGDPAGEIPIGLIAPLGHWDSGRPKDDNVFEIVAHGTSAGFKTMGRSLVISGKSTAAFFSKVGSSIKKAF